MPVTLILRRRLIIFVFQRLSS